jgi:hypothetical protein
MLNDFQGRHLLQSTAGQGAKPFVWMISTSRVGYCGVHFTNEGTEATGVKFLAQGRIASK